MLKQALELSDVEEKTGYVIAGKTCDILDLGDDFYTKGKPHPMMDSEVRKKNMEDLTAEISDPVIVLMDVVLGYGAEGDPASELAKSIRKVREAKAGRKEQVIFIVNLLGAKEDPQDPVKQAECLRAAGAYVYEGSFR